MHEDQIAVDRFTEDGECQELSRILAGFEKQAHTTVPFRLIQELNLPIMKRRSESAIFGVAQSIRIQFEHFKGHLSIPCTESNAKRRNSTTGTF